MCPVFDKKQQWSLYIYPVEMILLNITFNFQVNIRHQDSMVRAFRLNMPNPAKQEATVKGVVCLPNMPIPSEISPLFPTDWIEQSGGCSANL